METTIVMLLTILLVTAMATDIGSSRIPNRLTFAVMAFALLIHAWLGGFHGMLFSLGGLGIGLGLFVLIYISGGIGAGDVKLMAAVGAHVGPYGALISALLAILVGGLYALAAMCYQWGCAATGRRLASAANGAIITRGNGWAEELQLPFRLRYGFAITGGTLLFKLGIYPFGG